MLDNKERGNYGKGYRAIYFSAFMFGLIQHSLKNNFGHPRFIVLDSPLNPFKERDLGSSDDNEQIPREMQDNFFRGLSNLDYLKRVQIIILDNREPPNDVKVRINNIHFSKDNKLGRYGFFPLA